MKKEESTQLKEGQTVYIAVKYLGTTTDGESAHVKIPTTDWMDIGHHSVVSISPNISFEHIVIPSPVKENKPKYDPCRKFRKGDKVEPKAVKGRPAIGGITGAIIKLSGQFFVARDESENENYTVTILMPDGTECEIDPAYLELVTPVEEMRPYSVRECKCSKSMEVRRDNSGRVCAVYYYGGECPAYTEATAKAAAEAERDRLNAEYRKEQI